MAQTPKSKAPADEPPIDRKRDGQIVLVFQGGGALGAYQAGVYQALHEAGIEPDWVIGTSIGAINAALIAGNPPEKRLKNIREFWTRARHTPLTQIIGAAPFFGAQFANMAQGARPGLALALALLGARAGAVQQPGAEQAEQPDIEQAVLRGDLGRHPGRADDPAPAVEVVALQARLADIQQFRRCR